jgi:hypothetical protein
MRLDFIDNLFEANASPRIPHPEDSIFDGSATAAKYVRGLQEVIANPGGVSIKWDGGIALIFGYTPAGEFFINDKYMPDGFFAKSPKDWERYDTTIKASRTPRTDLYPKIALVWEGIKAAVKERAVFKGDLMSVGQLQPQQGMFIFSPTTVQYRVPVKSALGQMIAGKVGILAVHQMNGAPWDGKTGLANDGNVAILSPTAGITFKLNSPTQLVNAANKAVTQYGKLSDEFLAGLQGVARQAIQKYFNHKITAQTNEELVPWLQHNISAQQFKKLVGENEDGYLYTNAQGLEALKAIWNAIYALKTNLAAQLEPQVQGFEQWTGGQKAGEGFVFNSPTAGMIKLVNRGVFGAAHFNK